jgi:FkbM family methyltransferase
VLEHVLYPLFRRVEFRGKARLRNALPVPREGRPVVRLPGGVALRLDLRESLQRDFYFGLCDQAELRFMREHLQGDMVDVGAHIGMYTVRAARELAKRGRGRVLAFEPNPSARAQLDENLRLNACENVIVVAAAAGAAEGRAVLHVPASADPSFSSLEPGRFAEGDAVDVETTTVDAAVASHDLAPSFLKVDVEGRELDVLRGGVETLSRFRPTLLVEVSEQSAPEVQRLLHGYRAYRIVRGRVRSGFDGCTGLFNVLFRPEDEAGR